MAANGFCMDAHTHDIIIIFIFSSSGGGGGITETGQ